MQGLNAKDKCSTKFNHKQPEEHDNNCKYCVVIFGFKNDIEYKPKRWHR